MERNRFTFFKSYHESGKFLKSEQRVMLFDAICAVQFLEILPEDVTFSEPMLQMAWANIEPIVTQSINGFLHKTKTDHPLSKGSSDHLAKGVNQPLSTQPTQHKEKEKEKEKEVPQQYSSIITTREACACGKGRIVDGLCEYCGLCL